MTISNSYPGYGAVPTVGGTAGHFLANGINGTSWNAALPQNAIQIGNPEAVITFNTDCTITTKSGTITAEDWIYVHKVMKQLIMDMSKDEELVSKYPYIRDAAHIWMMNELKGKE
jgi:hypothetical protein